MDKYIIFGAGNFGIKAIELIGSEKIDFFIDNNSKKYASKFYGFSVYSLETALEKLTNQTIVIAVSNVYMEEIKKQLEESGVYDYETLRQVQTRNTREKIEQKTDYMTLYKKATKWIKVNTVQNEGIINNSDLRKSYPEVTGYYIPTLLRWGYRDMAVSFARWLCGIQKADGSWYDTYDKAPYIFDTAQILKGLIAVREIYPKVDGNIIKGCDWILSRMTEEGQLVTPTKEAWGDKRTCSELIHIYCLSPLVQAAEIFGKPAYKEKAFKILEWYKTNYYDDIMNFNLLSHFYAYVMEGLLDMDETELAAEAMKKMEHRQKSSGAVPAYSNVDWVCSTGLFQMAAVWFRLGNLECGKKAFEYACKLQNKSGGWYGSYLSEENPNEENTYFPDSEISWASKYFLDALYYKNIAEFDMQAPIFLDEIERIDGRYQIVYRTIKEKGDKVLEVGCGKGRYLKRLNEDVPSSDYCAVDLSERAMDYFSSDIIEKKQGSLTNIPYKNNIFDVVYACESLEHAVDIESAIAEMSRVTKKGGKIVIIDKNRDMLGYLEIEEWEQWFDEKELKDIMLKYCSCVDVEKEISYEGNKSNGLFYAWIGTVK